MLGNKNKTERDLAAAKQDSQFCKTTSWVAVTGVLTAIFVYGLAAAEAASGRYPGAYTSLVMIAPLGLLVNNIGLFIAVAQTILPTRTAVVSFLAAILGAMMFQASVTQRMSKRIVVSLALLNLSLFVYSGFYLKRLERSEMQLQCIGQDRIAALLRSGMK